MKLKTFIRESRDLLAVAVVSPLLLFSDLFPRAASVGGAFLLLAFCLAKLFRDGNRYSVAASLLVPFVGLSLLSLAVSIDFDTTLQGIYSLETGCAIFFLAGGLRKVPGWVTNTWTHLFAGSVVLLALIGPLLAQYRVPRKFLDFTIPAPGMAGLEEKLDANILGSLIAIALVLALGILLGQFSCGSHRGLSLLMLSWSLSLATLLLLSQSRSAIISALVALAAMTALVWRQALFLLAGATGIAGLFLWWRGPDLLWSMARATGTLESMAFRVEIWERARYAIQDFPFTGIGAGTFQDAVLHLYPLIKLSPSAAPYHSHNLYLQVALDLGIGGLVAFTTLASLGIIIGFQAFRSGSRLALGYLGAIFVVLITGWLDSPLWLNKPSAVIFFLFGMLLVLHFSQEREVAGELSAANPSLTRISFLLVLWLLFTLSSIALLPWHFGAGLAVATGGGCFLGWEWSRLVVCQSHSPLLAGETTVHVSE